ncbi:hypothetical protein ACFS3C_15300 [Azotobacter vinelandii]
MSRGDDGAEGRQLGHDTRQHEQDQGEHLHAPASGQMGMEAAEDAAQRRSGIAHGQGLVRMVGG